MKRGSLKAMQTKPCMDPGDNSVCLDPVLSGNHLLLSILGWERKNIKQGVNDDRGSNRLNEVAYLNSLEASVLLDD
jgi:hypothetical protein